MVYQSPPKLLPLTDAQLHIFILGISPMIWRRIKIRSDSTIADLHYIIQIVMGWTDSHLHRFIIHGKHYGIAQIGGMWFSDDPRAVKLSDFGWRMRERFLYEYDFSDNWQHQMGATRFCENSAFKAGGRRQFLLEV